MVANRQEIVAAGLQKSFGETKALIDCSFSIKCGEIHAIVGENGSGKSTLAKILSGVLLPDGGSFQVFGSTPTSPSEARKLGIVMIYQEILVADEASVAENLFAGWDSLFRKRISRAEMRIKARSIMNRLSGVDVDPCARVGTLPLNLKQWIVICRALLNEPKLLILDESSAALDLDATARLHKEIFRLRDLGSTIIIVTHRIAELIRVSDRATVLCDGKVAGTLEKSEINEHNLLLMMSPQKRVDREPPEVCARGTANGGCSALKAEGLKITQESTPFDFELSKGKIVGIIGLDGQGQEQFVRILAGIEPAYEGSPMVIKEDGRQMPLLTLKDAERLGVSYVSGDRKKEGIFPNLSILENFAFSLYGKNLLAGIWINKKPIHDAYAFETKRLNIKFGRQLDLITSLSGGNQQKIVIGRVLAMKPNIIILNDPVRGVDIGTKREFYQELTNYVYKGGAVVYLSSEIEEFLGFADIVVAFRDNSIFRSLTGKEIFEENMLAAMFGHNEAIDIESGLENVRL